MDAAVYAADIVLEIMPWSNVPTIDTGLGIVSGANQTNGRLLINIWQLRAGTFRTQTFRRATLRPWRLMMPPKCRPLMIKSAQPVEVLPETRPADAGIFRVARRAGLFLIPRSACLGAGQFFKCCAPYAAVRSPGATGRSPNPGPPTSASPARWGATPPMPAPAGACQPSAAAPSRADGVPWRPTRPSDGSTPPVRRLALVLFGKRPTLTFHSTPRGSRAYNRCPLIRRRFKGHLGRC